MKHIYKGVIAYTIDETIKKLKKKFKMDKHLKNDICYFLLK